MTEKVLNRPFLARHRAMVDAAAVFLNSIGATDIEYEYKIGSRLVDLFAVGSNGATIAVECGTVYYMEDRLGEIANEVDVFYWLPVMPLMFQLVAKDMDSYSCGDGVLHCSKCGYDWAPKVKRPLMCPACKSRKWDANPWEVKDELVHASVK